MTTFRTTTRPLLALLALAPAVARAHVDVASGRAFAGATQKVTFSVGHGCAGADTASVEIAIPAGVSSVRPMTSDFGPVTVVKDQAGTVTAVRWEQRDEDLIAADERFYELTVRFRVPDAPFTTIHFPSVQTCRTGDGGTLVTEWVGTPTSPDAGVEVEPAPGLRVVPQRLPGWNRYAVPVALPDDDALEAFLGDAVIVWRGTAAYSSNPETAAQIAATAGVSALTSVDAGDELWVRY